MGKTSIMVCVNKLFGCNYVCHPGTYKFSNRYQYNASFSMERELLLYCYKENKINSANNWINFIKHNNKRLFQFKSYYAPDRPSLGKIQNYMTKKIHKDRETAILLQQSYECSKIINGDYKHLLG